MWMQTLCLTFFCVLVASILGHPGRPLTPDNPEARKLFKTAEENRTQDGFLTHEEVADIFAKFDINGNGMVDAAEFSQHWKELGLGGLQNAMILFHRADTDKDGSITEVPDMSRVFYYFDRDGDGRVSEPEFSQVWYSLST